MNTREAIIGDIIGVWDGTHLAHIKVGKINRATFDGTEEPRSHIPKRRWRVNKKAPFAFIGQYPNGTMKVEWQNI